MTQTLDEQISAFGDGELPDEELELLLRQLARNGEHRATLARYSLIGELIRGEAIDRRVNSLSSSVMEAVGESAAADTRGADYGLRNMANRLAPSVIGGAVAATVAVLAIFGLGLVGTEPTLLVTDEPSLAQLEQADAGLEGGETFSYTVPASTDRKAGITPARLTSYLVSHGEYARSFSWTVMDSRIVPQQTDAEE